MILFDRLTIFKVVSFLQLNCFTPTRFRVSQIRFDLIHVSRGESVPKAGERLISNSHGLRAESIRMSNPYSSKLFFWLIPFCLMNLVMPYSPDIRIFRTRSMILCHIRVVSIPIALRCLKRAEIDHLEPESSLSTPSFYSNFLLFLLME